MVNGHGDGPDFRPAQQAPLRNKLSPFYGRLYCLKGTQYGFDLLSIRHSCARLQLFILAIIYPRAICRIHKICTYELTFRRHFIQLHTQQPIPTSTALAPLWLWRRSSTHSVPSNTAVVSLSNTLQGIDHGCEGMFVPICLHNPAILTSFHFRCSIVTLQSPQSRFAAPRSRIEECFQCFTKRQLACDGAPCR